MTRRIAEPCPFYKMPCQYVPMAHKSVEQSAEIERLRAALKRVLDSGLLFGPTVMHDKIREQARAALTAQPAEGEKRCMIW